MHKSTTKIILAIALLCILGYVAFWLMYYFSIERSNKQGLEMACKENREQEFVGKILNIDTFEYDNFMYKRFFNLHIRINDSTKEYIDYFYNLKPNEEILDFARPGQKATKIKGEDRFELTDSTGKKKYFVIAKCAKIN